jgi:hypothetical protein
MGCEPARDKPNRLLKKAWPPIDADERRLKTNALSALICVYRRPKWVFSILVEACQAEPFTGVTEWMPENFQKQ